MSKTTQIYVLRIWHEAREPPNWRASLSDLNAQEKNYFTSPSELITFINECVAVGQKKVGISSHGQS